MATGNALPPAVRAVVEAKGAVPGGLIPLSHTIFLWQSQVAVLVELIAVTLVMWLAAPPPGRARGASQLGIDLGPPLDLSAPGFAAATNAPRGQPARPTLGERVEHSPILTLLVVALGASYLGRYFWRAPDRLGAIDLNTINLAFLLVGFALHGTPARLMRAVRDATPAVWGVLLQFPFYAGIAGMIGYTHLNERIAHLFVRVSSPTTFPPLIAVYSAVLGVFVPSGGSKWVIEAPYVMASAHQLHVHLGWMVSVYDLGEALANLVQPFWMLPTLALLRLRARDVMGYTFVVFLVLLPLVLAMVTLLGRTLRYPL
jgi:short-chain fatty acids transporter